MGSFREPPPAGASDPTYVTASQQRAEALAAVGMRAVSWPSDAARENEFVENLRGARVEIVPDCDPAWAARCQRLLTGVAADVEVWPVPVLPGTGRSRT